MVSPRKSHNPTTVLALAACAVLAMALTPNVTVFECWQVLFGAGVLMFSALVEWLRKVAVILLVFSLSLVAFSPWQNPTSGLLLAVCVFCVWPLVNLGKNERDTD